MSFIIYINVSAFFLMLTAILFMNSPFCFYSFIFTKFDRVRQILYNIEGKNMERGMSMMKSSVKKIGALVAAAVMVCAIFVGCGSSKYDTSTPDGRGRPRSGNPECRSRWTRPLRRKRR